MCTIGFYKNKHKNQRSRYENPEKEKTRRESEKMFICNYYSFLLNGSPVSNFREVKNYQHPDTACCQE